MWSFGGGGGFCFVLLKQGEQQQLQPLSCKTPPSGWETRRSGLLGQQGLKKTQCLLRRQTYKPCTEGMRKVSRCPWCPVSVSQTRGDPRAHGRQTQQTKPKSFTWLFSFLHSFAFYPHLPQSKQSLSSGLNGQRSLLDHSQLRLPYSSGGVETPGRRCWESSRE